MHSFTKYGSIVLFIFISSFGYSQGPNLLWQRATGGNGDDFGYAIEVDDSGYVYVAGSTGTMNDGDVSSSCYQTTTNSMQDQWFVKYDSLGNLIWSKCLSIDGRFYDMRKINDHQFVLLGWACNQPILCDMYIATVDTAGNVGLFDYIIGGPQSDDYGYSVTEGDSGRFYGLGISDMSAGHGGFDMYLSITDSAGTIERVYGGSDYDEGQSVIRLHNNKYLLTGSTNSSNGDISSNHGNTDVWIVIVDSVGIMIREKTYGGTESEFGRTAIELSNGNIIIGTTTLSNDGDVSGNHSNGGSDVWIFMIDSVGNLLWQKCYGGMSDETISSLSLLNNNIILVGASATSTEGDVIGNHGNGGPDFWLFTIDTLGNMLSSQCYGGTGFDILNKVINRNNKIYVTGTTNSDNNGDVSNYHFSANYIEDLWVAVLDTNLITKTDHAINIEENFILYPNPATDKLYINNKKKKQTESFAIKTMDVFGKTVEQFIYNQFPVIIDLENYSSGIYFISIYSKTISYHKKFIKN